MEVLSAYRNDWSSLRPGLFLARLCLQKKPYNGVRVTPDWVIEEFNRAPGRSNKCLIAKARFKAECCLRDLRVNGQLVTPDAVVNDYRAANAPLELARFKAECCLRNLLLNGLQVTPDTVVNDYRSANAPLELARFKEQCCLRGLLLNGQKVIPEAVVNDFPESLLGKLGIARFKAECCQRGLLLDGQQVLPDAVVNDYRAAKALLELARFKQECCLRGLLLNGQQVTPDEVVNDFPENFEGKMGIARFKEECCLRGLWLNGQPVTSDAVVNDFPESPKGKLGIARFKAECCLRDLRLNGQQVTPDEVVNDFPENLEGKLGIARFKAECCIRGLQLNGQQVTPDAVVNDFPRSLQGKLGIARFKEECCLKGLLLNGQQITPDAVNNIYKQGGWLLELAIFYSQLALNAKKLNAHYLNNHQVLTAFRKVPGDHSSRQVDYLIQRLKTLPGQDETDDTLETTFKHAWQIANNAPLKDDENRHQQCILRFMAMQYELPVDHHKLSAEQVLQTISDLRSSVKKTRLHFFFLAHCYHTKQSLNGQKVQKHQVLDCLEGLPEGSKLRHALGCWFEERSAEASPFDELLFRWGNLSGIRRESDSPQGVEASVRQPECEDHLLDMDPVAGSSGQRVEKVAVFIPNFEERDSLSWRFAGYYHETLQSGTAAGDVPLAVVADAGQVLKQLLNTGEPTASDRQVPQLSLLTNKSFEIIHEVNGIYTSPVILITGSLARYLQGIGSSFSDIDIDIISTTEEAASILIDRLRTLNTDMDSEVGKKVVAWAIPGCPEIRLPLAYNIWLVEGDLGTKTMGLQVSIDSRVRLGNKDVAPVHLPGVDRPVSCLSIAAEIRLISDTLEFLADQLDPLTKQLQKGAGFDIPRTILFNLPQSPEERIYGLLMRCLLILNKAKRFHSLLAEGKTGYRLEQYSTTICHFQQLTDRLHGQLKSHTCRDHFVRRLEDWISNNQPFNDYEKKQCQFITSLLEMIIIE